LSLITPPYQDVVYVTHQLNPSAVALATEIHVFYKGHLCLSLISFTDQATPATEASQ